MNRERAKELWSVIKAYAEGKTVQYSTSSLDWLDIDHPSFDDVTRYRIKPEPREWWGVLYYCGDGDVELFKTEAEAYRQQDKFPNISEVITLREVMDDE